MREIQPGQGRDKKDAGSYMPKKNLKNLVSGAQSSSSSGNSSNSGCGTNSTLGGETITRILKK